MRQIRRAARGLGRLLLWPFRTSLRLVTLGWLIGCTLVGGALNAMAEGDGFINVPDLAGGGAQTVFEKVPLTAYTLPFGLSDSQTDGIGGYFIEAVWQVFRGLGNVLMYLTLALVRGAIACMQWLLNLTIYRDNASQIDGAVQSLANAVFWPLLAVTIAIAGATIYGRMKKEGGGSIFSDTVWLITAAVLAVTFAAAPSKIAGTLDQTRTLLADRIVEGYASTNSAQSVAGFPSVDVQASGEGASRALGDAMWNVYAVAPWCWAAYGDLNICKDVGHDYLEDTDRYKQLYQQQRDLNSEGENADDAKCPAEWQANCAWVRGQSYGRLGGVVFAAVTGIPLALMLLGIVIYGIMAIVGLVLLTLVGLIFLLFWMIPGRPRQIGIRWFEALIGCLLQSVIITALLGAVMVLGGLFNAMLPTYGLFMVGLLNIAAMVMVFKIRGMFENMTGLSSPASSPLVSGYMAARALSSLGRTASRTTRAATQTAAGAGAAGVGAAKFAHNQVTNPASAANRTGRALRAGFDDVRTGFDMASKIGAAAPKPAAPAARTPYAPAYRRPGAASASAPAPSGQLAPGATPSRGASVIDALPAGPGGTARRALTSGSSSTTTTVDAPAGASDTRRRFAADSGRPGVAPDARRRIIQPMRRDIQTPPITPSRQPARITVVGTSTGRSLTATRSLAPLTPRSPSTPPVRPASTVKPVAGPRRPRAAEQPMPAPTNRSADQGR